MTVVQHFADKRKPISVQLQLKSGGCLEWYHNYSSITIININIALSSLLLLSLLSLQITITII